MFVLMNVSLEYLTFFMYNYHKERRYIMKSLEKMTFSQNAQKIISLAFYIVFAGLSIYKILQADQISTKIIFSALLILILGIALYSEYLKHLYKKAIQTIAFDLNPEKAAKQFNTLLKKDIFHAYTNDKKIFDTLYYIDQMEYEKCLEHIEENYKFFHASVDQLLIYHYNKFYCSFMLNRMETAKQEYNKLERMKNTKVKGAKVSPLFNWEFMDAIYLVSRKDYKQSYNVFKTVNTENMNPREKVQYYYQFALLCQKIKDKVLCENQKNKIINLKGSSHTCKKGGTL